MKTSTTPWASDGAIELRKTDGGRPYIFRRRDAPATHEVILAPAGEALSRTMSNIAAGLSASASN